MDTAPASSASPFMSANLRAGAAIYQPGQTFGPRKLNDFEIVWITAGKAAYHHDGQVVSLPAGSVLLARPGFFERYQWDRNETSRHAFVHFDIVHKPDDWPAEQDWPIARAAADAGLPVAILRELIELVNARATQKLATATAREQRLLAALLDVLIMPTTRQAHAQMDRLPEPVRRALDAIVANAERESCEPLDLDDLTRVAKVSRTHLIRLFRQHVAQTPIATVQMTRLDRAMTVLERSNLSMTQIAARLGFASPYHFSRRFTQAFGLPPSRMRARLRSGGARPAPLMPMTQKLLLPQHARLEKK